MVSNGSKTACRNYCHKRIAHINIFYGISYVSLQNSGAVAKWTTSWWRCQICNENHSSSFTFAILFFIEIHHSTKSHHCHFDSRGWSIGATLTKSFNKQRGFACASLKIGRKAVCCSKTRTFCAFLCQAARCARYLLVHGGFYLLLVGQRCRTCTCSLTHASLES